MMKDNYQYSVITPSRGNRPKALKVAIASVEAAAKAIWPLQVEMLVGFDGVRGERVAGPSFVRFLDLPKDNNWGNGIRDILLRACTGKRVIFLDDDNVLTPKAFVIYEKYPQAELILARIDTSLAFEIPYLPKHEAGKSLVRLANVDSLCVCATRDLVVDRCGGWLPDGGYEADYLNIQRYYRRAHNQVESDEVVGIYDFGQGLDKDAKSPLRQRNSE